MYSVSKSEKLTRRRLFFPRWSVSTTRRVFTCRFYTGKKKKTILKQSVLTHGAYRETLHPRDNIKVIFQRRFGILFHLVTLKVITLVRLIHTHGTSRYVEQKKPRLHGHLYSFATCLSAAGYIIFLRIRYYYYNTNFLLPNSSERVYSHKTLAFDV